MRPKGPFDASQARLPRRGQEVVATPDPLVLIIVVGEPHRLDGPAPAEVDREGLLCEDLLGRSLEIEREVQLQLHVRP